MLIVEASNPAGSRYGDWPRRVPATKELQSFESKTRRFEPIDLPENLGEIFSMNFDLRGRLWLGFVDKIGIYNPKTNTTEIKDLTDKGLKTNGAQSTPGDLFLETGLPVEWIEPLEPNRVLAIDALTIYDVRITPAGQVDLSIFFNLPETNRSVVSSVARVDNELWLGTLSAGL